MTSQKTFLEKRKHHRVVAKVPVQYRLVDHPPGPQEMRGRTALAKDMSLQGLFVVTDHPMKVGDILRLDISVPEPRRQLFAFAEVVRVDPRDHKGAGIRLMMMPVEDQESLGTYLEKRGKTAG